MCHPIPGDPIVGCRTQENTVMVHHQHCANLKNARRQSLAQWDNAQSAVSFEAELQIEILNEQMPC